MYNFDSSLISNKQQQSASQNLNSNQDAHSELTSSYNELNYARHRLRLLEMKIKTLEIRIAKKYPDVLFLNYKNRKRILVSDQILQPIKCLDFNCQSIQFFGCNLSLL